MLKSYKIRNIEIRSGLVLAPMSGVTCGPFRRLIHELNPGCVGLLVSEFISVEGMTRGSRKSVAMMRFEEWERPYAVQIFGYDPIRMRDAALMVQDAGVDIVDINCGCPAPKVVKNGGGCELMRQPEHLAKILRLVRSAVSIPLTMKFRSGWDLDCLNAVEVARVAESEGVEALTVHGRTRTQLYRGEADWDVVGRVANAVRIPVAGSGDVVDRASAMARIASGAAGLYIGRAAINNPFVFRDVITGSQTRVNRNERLALEVLTRYVELLRQEFNEIQSIGKLKQLASQMCRGIKWQRELLRINTFEGQLAFLKRASDAVGASPLDIDAPERRSPETASFPLDANA